MEIQKLIQKTTDAFNRHDPVAFADVFSPDAKCNDPQYEYALQGKDAIRKDIDDFIRAFPDVQMKITSPVLVNGSTVAFEAEVSGTHNGILLSPGGDIPPTNKSMSFKVGQFINLTPEGKIQSVNRYYDMMTIMAQLGLMSENA